MWDGWEDDGDIANLSKEDKLHWVLLGGYLKKHGNTGMTCLSKPALALQKKLGLTTYEDLVSVLKKMPGYVVEEKQNPNVTEVTILTVTGKNWFKYQGDNSKLRTRKWRQSVTLKKRREEKRKEEKRNVFVPPTPFEAEDYAKTLGFVLDGEKFVAHYQKTGWKLKGGPITDWKACVVTWKKNNFDGNGKNGKPDWQ